MAAPARAPRLPIDSLRAALQAAMDAPAARRAVYVRSVHVAQSGALLAFLRFENAGRLADLVSLDRLLRAIADDIVPALVADPTSLPTLALLSRYSRYVKSSATSVGGDFAHCATGICDELIAYVDTASRRPLPLSAPELLRRSKVLLARVHSFRSKQLTIARSDPLAVPVPVADSDSDPNSDEDVFMALDGLHFTSLRSALQEVVDSPADELRVTVDAARASHSSALLGVVRFQATACGWTVRNLGRVTALADVDAGFEVIGLGLLRILNTNPVDRPAHTLLFDFVTGLRLRVGAVGGDFVERATNICDRLIAHAITGAHLPLLVPAPEMRRRTQQLRQDVSMFRALTLSIHSGSDMEAASTSASSSDSDTAPGSDVPSDPDIDMPLA